MNLLGRIALLIMMVAWWAYGLWLDVRLFLLGIGVSVAGFGGWAYWRHHARPKQ